MQIAICDDEKDFRDELKTRIIEYRTQKLIATDIYEFNDGQSLLNSNQVFDIIFIDYQMPGLDGLETAKMLRKKNLSAVLSLSRTIPALFSNRLRFSHSDFLKSL